MTDTKNTGGPACAWCDADAHIKQGRIWLCQIHYRISSMRSRSKRDGKYTPTRQEIESMIPNPLVCTGCDRGMVWLQRDGASQQVTLQHDRDGTLRLVCLTCNTRHAQHPGDTYWDIPKGKKRCGKCSQIIPLNDFSKDASRPSGKKASCRKCSAKSHKKWRVKNREYYNAKQRERRAKRYEC